MNSFFGKGIRLEQNIALTIKKPLQILQQPATGTVPLWGCSSLDHCIIKPGAKVRKFLSLSAAEGHVPAICTLSGTFLKTKTMVHPLCGETLCAVIEADDNNRTVRTRPFTEEEMSQDDFIDAAQAAGIVDECDGVPLFQKLRQFRDEKADLLIIGAFNDQPYETASFACLQNNAAMVLTGMRIVSKACGIEEQKIAVNSKSRCKKIPEFKNQLAAAKLMEIPSRYPAWFFLQRKLTAQKKRPVLIGVQACAALGNAIKNGEPQTSIIVTVAGDGLEHSVNFQVPIGTSVKDLLQVCKLKEKANAVILNSVITGTSITDLELPILPVTRSVIVLDNYTKSREYACIGCGKCYEVCPTGIIPWHVQEQLQQEKPENDKLINVQKCIHCNCCSLICPSGIPLEEKVSEAIQRKKRGTKGDTKAGKRSVR